MCSYTWPTVSAVPPDGPAYLSETLVLGITSAHRFKPELNPERGSADAPSLSWEQFCL
jgi:hypothetical protein